MSGRMQYLHEQGNIECSLCKRRTRWKLSIANMAMGGMLEAFASLPDGWHWYRGDALYDIEAKHEPQMHWMAVCPECWDTF